MSLVRQVRTAKGSEAKMTGLIPEETRTRLQIHLPQPEALELITEAMARKYTAIPLAIKDNALRVAMANPADILALEALSTQSQMRIEAEAASTEDILEAIDANYKAYDEIEMLTTAALRMVNSRLRQKGG